jgi:EpsI family protein
MMVDEYAGQELPVEDWVKELLETPNVLMRQYRSPSGAIVSLVVVYYDQYRVYFHMPEGCMVGRGTIITATETETIETENGETPKMAVNKLILNRPNHEEHVLYYFSAGGLVTPSYPRMRFHLMKEHLLRKRTGAALIRFSAVVNQNSSNTNPDELRRFVARMTPILQEVLN